MQRAFFILLTFSLFTLAGNSLTQAQSPKGMFKVKYKGKSFIGKPMAWTGKDLLLLRRNGKLSELPVASQNQMKKVSNTFKPYSFSDMEKRLTKEFGKNYQITKTENYLVVHPHGNAKVWAAPFQDLFYRFDDYFSTRGIQPKQPEFPLVAVVFRSRKEFDKKLERYNAYNPGTIGFYYSNSNRVFTYDQSSQYGVKKASWIANNDTLVHEATHQVAFNTGIHSRFAAPSRWISEGLATYFEAKGVNHSSFYSKQKDRINIGRLISLQSFYREGKVKGAVEKLIVNDDLFRTDGDLAYALSWGLTFYLNEKKPNAYRALIKRDGSRAPFSTFTSKDRSKLFASTIGPDINDLEARMKKFIMGLSPR